MARKGTVITEEQITWREIGPDARKAAMNAAAAAAAKGTPMSDEEMERRARNAQDRADIRDAVNGGNLGTDCKTMSRAELIAAINEQLQKGLYGTGSKAGFKKVQAMQYDREHAPRTMSAKYAGTCHRCQKPFAAGDQIVWNPDWKITDHVACR